MLAWFYAGGGEKLYTELVNDILKLNLVGFLYFPMPTQPLGWFKSELKDPSQFKNMKYRTVGLSADVFREMGAAVTILAGGEIVPALDRGLVDAAEFNNPSSDILLGFPDVAKNFMMGSHHQQAECFEVIFNKQRYDKLPNEVKAILRNAAHAASSDQIYTAYDRYTKDLEAIKKRGVNVVHTNDKVLNAQLQAWTKVIAAQEKDPKTGPFFKKVLDSQRDWVKRTQVYLNVNNLSTSELQAAYKHFFG
jgi:TRAP-type mannitol/chloroaromatic compound transport system substrate-binding protein